MAAGRRPWDLRIRTNQKAGCEPWPCKEPKADTGRLSPWPCPKAAGRPPQARAPQARAPRRACQAPYNERMSVPGGMAGMWPSCRREPSPERPPWPCPHIFPGSGSRASTGSPSRALGYVRMSPGNGQPARRRRRPLEEREVRNLVKESGAAGGGGSVIHADSDLGGSSRRKMPPSILCPAPHIPSGHPRLQGE